MALVLNGSANTIGGLAVGGLPDGIVDTDMIAAGAVTGAKKGAGSILQVVQEHRTDTWSETVAQGAKSGACITKAITTASSSNKVLVSFHLTLSAGSAIANRLGVTLKRGGTEIALSDDTSDNKLRATTSTLHTNVNQLFNVGFEYLDSPGSAASHSYTLHICTGSSSNKTVYLNRSYTESNDSYRHRGTSHLTLKEVSA